MLTPALTGFLLEADPTRRSLPFAASAQLMGAAILPTVAGMMIETPGEYGGIDTVLIACSAAVVLGLALLAAALAARPRLQPDA